MANTTGPKTQETKKTPFKEIVQPFLDLLDAPRALWGINLSYLLEGMAYFGILGYLAIHFSDHIFLKDTYFVALLLRDPDRFAQFFFMEPDIWSHRMVLVLTAGITISMFFLGTLADRYGIRKTLIASFVCLFVGRLLISGAPGLFAPAGLWSPLHMMTMAGILAVVIGYGMYQPAAYAGVRKFTSNKTSAMGFAMLYALMNMGGYIPTFAFLLRDEQFAGIGITGVFWVYTCVTLASLFATAVILTGVVEKKAIERAKRERELEAAEAATAQSESEAPQAEDTREAMSEAAAAPPRGLPARMAHWLKHHPLGDLRFTFFIFALIPVQTLYTYNWLVLPQYISRAYTGWVGDKFEIAANFNPLLIFIFVPIVTALTQKKKVYNMMITGTFIMAAPAFLLALGTNAYLLFGYLLLMTIGEALWQPRFFQYAVEIAPEGRTGEYMGVAQLPWFLTKVIAPLYTGHMMATYCPADPPRDPETMWLIFGSIALISPALLVIAKGWLSKNFRPRSVS